ncbi:MAG TPA: hypothetical protein VGN35_11160 [Jatrophihabitantaceae bacterium]|nr:hypothetical protein [Jatrophihabitantaceae bacterium]
MRRVVFALVALSLGALALLGGPTLASATPRTAVAGPPCPGSTLYPPSPDATIMSSTTTPVIGQKIDASGIKYCPNENVTLTIAGQFVGTAHTDSAGSFDPTQVTVPGPVGDKLLCGIGASGLVDDRDCLTLHVRAGSGPNSNHLGSTGVEVATIIAVAVALLGGGALFLSAGRRRKSARV